MANYPKRNSEGYYDPTAYEGVKSMVVRSKTQTSKVRRPDMERCELYKPGDWKTRWETELHEGGKQE